MKLLTAFCQNQNLLLVLFLLVGNSRVEAPKFESCLGVLEAYLLGEGIDYAESRFLFQGFNQLIGLVRVLYVVGELLEILF